MSIYRPILKNAWQILWRAKYLWVFGLFAVLIGNNGEVNLAINNYSSIGEQSSFLRDMKLFYSQGMMDNWAMNLKEIFVNFDVISVLTLVGVIIAFLIILWIAVVSQGGLVAGADKEYHRQSTNFSTIFRIGKNNFWKVLGINVLGKVVIFGILLILGIPLALTYIQQASAIGQILFMILSFIILIPLAIIISFLIKFAVMYVIIKKEETSEAIRKSWRLFYKNWIVAVEMAIVLFLFTIAVGLAMFILAMLITLPVSWLLYIFNALQIGNVLLIGILTLLLVFVLLVFWLGALLSTFQHTAWVILFDRLTEGKVYAKILRLFAGRISDNKTSNKEIK